MWRHHFGTSDLANTTVSSKDNDWCQVTFESSIHVCETLDVEHVNFIDEKNTWYEFSDTMVNVTIHNFVNLESKLLRDFRLLWSINLAHQTEEIMATLWSCIRNIQVM